MQRYATWDDVLDYCVYSANPVGRLVLYLCDYRDEERQRLSDFTCTALQLANFWQDVSRDLEKGRIYIPLDALAAHGLAEADIVARRFDERYVALMKELIAKTRELFDAGLPLAERVDAALRIDIELFSRGGIAILDAIEASGYNTLQSSAGAVEWTQAAAARPRAGSTRIASLSIKLSEPTPARYDYGRHLSSRDSAGGRSNAASRRQRLGSAIRASYAECNRIARAAHSSFYLAFFGLPRRSATRCARSTPSCAWSTTSPTSPATSNRSAAAWPAGARCSTKSPPAVRTVTRFFRRSRTRLRALRFRRATSTI